MKPHRLFLFIFGVLLMVIVFEVAFYFFSASRKNPEYSRQCEYPKITPTPKLNNEDVKQICQMFNSYKKTPNKLMKIVIENSGIMQSIFFDSANKLISFDLIDKDGKLVERYKNMRENQYVAVFLRSAPEKKISMRDLVENEPVVVRITEEVLYGSLVPTNIYWIEIIKNK